MPALRLGLELAQKRAFLCRRAAVKKGTRRGGAADDGALARNDAIKPGRRGISSMENIVS